MKVLVACEYSGRVRDAFIALGHDAISCDLLPTEAPGPHYEGDVFDLDLSTFDLMVAHPPCTYLSRAGARWWSDPERQEQADQAAAFVRRLYDSPVPMVAIENPIGQLNRLWRYPDQTIQPHHFGERYSKATCLWLKNLPPLMATVINSDPEPYLDSNPGSWKRRGITRRRGVAKTTQERNRTFQGIANAMAWQWGGPVATVEAKAA